MSTKIETGHRYLKKAGVAIAAALISATSVAAVAAEQSQNSEAASGTIETRTSESLHFSDGGRANNRDPAKGIRSVDEYGALNATGSRSKAVSKSLSNDAVSAAQASSADFWIYDADVDLFYDDDGDGYYYGIDLLFDADTIYTAAEVYAAVYLSYEGGPWNEYAVTNDFTIFGAGAGDEYVLVTELMSGYPTGDYDLLIELFDAVDGAFLASFGPEDSSELSFLPLEDFNRDDPGDEIPVAVSSGGGGATSIWLLFALLAGRILRGRGRDL